MVKKALRIEMDGTPVAYSRSRFRGKANPKGAGTPQATRALEDLSYLTRGAVEEYRRAVGEKWDSGRPVRVDVSFEFPRPRSEGGRGRGYGKTVIIVTQLNDRRWRTERPDVDNLAKLVMEGLQHGGAVEDDSQVAKLVAWKVREET